MRRPIQREICASRISSLCSALEWKYSSTRPFVNVPSTRGPIAYADERVWRMCSSVLREMSDPDDGP